MNAMYIAGIRYLLRHHKARIMAVIDAAVRTVVGELVGFRKKSKVRETAVAPKLVPSFHASVWTRNQAKFSSVWCARNSMKLMNPSGARIGATRDFQSLSSLMASRAATPHARTNANPLGRLAVPIAARTPAHTQAFLWRAIKQRQETHRRRASE